MPAHGSGVTDLAERSLGIYLTRFITDYQQQTILEEGLSEDLPNMEELKANARELMAEKKTIEDQEFKEWEKYPRCALLPSPEKLNTSVNSPGSDVTDTLKDFKRIIK